MFRRTNKRFMKSNVSKFTALVIIVAQCYLFCVLIYYYWIHQNLRATNDTNIALILPHVIVHIDLKGAPPKLSYLESLLPLMKGHGANGLLMEYEDMFPYEDTIANLSAKNAYGKTELQNFLLKALRTGFDIIPLIQTFGHMEHALKLNEFRHLREDLSYADSICPSKIGSRVLINEMLTQVIKFHNNISILKYVHIGCDEVYHINKCDECLNRARPTIDIFNKHVRSVTDIVKALSSDTNVLIWDDMLRVINPIQWTASERIPNVELVYWDYSPSVAVSHRKLLQYHRRFEHLWIASAYKGADGRTATLPDLRTRFMNHFTWLNFIRGYKFGGETQVYQFRGIILTGWSRYGHMEPLCELLPVSIPSLVMNLLLIKKLTTEFHVFMDPDYDYDYILSKNLDSEMNESMLCKMNVDSLDASSCSFESRKLYDLLKQNNDLNRNIIAKLFSEEDYLVAPTYYITLGRMNKLSFAKHIVWVNDSLRELEDLEVTTRRQMLRYYHNDVVDEFLGYKLDYVKQLLKQLMNVFDNYKQKYVWQRNPPDLSIKSHERDFNT